VASTGGTATTKTITSLTNGQAYWFRVSAINSVGTGSVSAVQTATPVAAPGAPTLAAPTVGVEQISLSWTAPSSDGGASITSYKIEQSTTSASAGFAGAGASTGSTATTKTITGLTSGQAYWFKVSATNSVGTSTPSAVQTATPTAAFFATCGETTSGGVAFADAECTGTRVYDSTTATATNPSDSTCCKAARSVPGSPTLATPTAGGAQISLSWTAPSNNGGASITSYKIEQSTTSASAGFAVAVASTDSTATSKTITGLTNGQAYWFKVSAINSVGTGTPSAAQTQTPATVPGSTTLATPTAGDTQIALSWTAPSSDGGASITSYKIEQSTTSASAGFTEAVASTGSTATTKTITGLTNGQDYWFRVTAINGKGTGTASPVRSATPAMVPGSPTIAARAAGDAQIELTWAAPASNGGASITSYKIEQSTTSATAGFTVAVASTGSTAITKTFTSLTNGQAYWFKVSAINTMGTGTASAVQTATPTATSTVPGSPTLSALTAGDAAISLSWTAPSSTGGASITSYKIEQSTTSASAGFTVAVASTGSTATSKTITGLTNGQAYWFKVSAINSVGTSATSASQTVSPAKAGAAPAAASPSPRPSVRPSSPAPSPRGDLPPPDVPPVGRDVGVETTMIFTGLTTTSLSTAAAKEAVADAVAATLGLPAGSVVIKSIRATTRRFQQRRRRLLAAGVEIVFEIRGTAAVVSKVKATLNAAEAAGVQSTVSVAIAAAIKVKVEAVVGAGAVAAITAGVTGTTVATPVVKPSSGGGAGGYTWTKMSGAVRGGPGRWGWRMGVALVVLVLMAAVGC
jgi:titin